MRTRIDNPELRRRQILLAAEAALGEKGYHNLLLDDVARHANLSKGTLYLYFQDKEALITSLLQEIASSFVAKISSPALEKCPPLEQLRRIIAAQLEFLKAHRDFFAQFSMLKPEIYGKPAAAALREHFGSNIKYLSDKIQRCVDHGDLRPIDTRVGALTVLSLLRMAGLHQSLIGATEGVEVNADLIMDIFLNGAVAARHGNGLSDDAIKRTMT